MKNTAGDIIILHMYTNVPNTTIIWAMVPDIQSETDRIFGFLDHFLPFYPPNNPENQILKQWKEHLEMSSFYSSVPKITIIYGVCFLRYGVQHTEFFVILGHFLPFHPTIDTKN